MPRLLFGLTVALGCWLVLISCTHSGNPAPLTNDSALTVKRQLTNGASIYAQTCATSSCHGTQGEGIRSGNGFSVWPLLGPQFQSRHPNAQIVFDVIRSGDEPHLRALTDQQIYDAIAYELSENQVKLGSPLTAANAFTTYGGSMSGDVPNGIFPPAEDVAIISAPPTRHLPTAAENEKLRLQVDQTAEASAIGNTQPPSGGAFLIMVFVLTDRDQTPITLRPDHLRLSTPSGELLQPQSMDMHSAIEKLHAQTIMFQHGTVALAVFTLSAPDQFDQLIYDDQVGNRLALALKP